MPAKIESTPTLPGLSPVGTKPVMVRFDGGRLSSDGGVLLLSEIERRLDIAGRLARCLEDPRAPERVVHGLADMIRFRMLAVACGYPDANDCATLRHDPAFKMAVGHLPETGLDLCSQPTMTRLENLPGPVALKRMMAAMITLFCDSFDEPPARLVLDIDDTEDCTYGEQQLSLFNAHHDSHCFMPIHIYEATTGKPVAMYLRPGRTPSGEEVALVLRHVVKALRRRWPKVDILVRGDSHYGRPEAMAWCERNQVGYVFGLGGNAVLASKVHGDVTRTLIDRQQYPELDKVRRYGEFRYGARSWKVERRVIARVEISDQGIDTRFIVTNLKGLEHVLYEVVYCARGQAENLIKAHKLHLASDRTSCTKATANQFRLMIHTAAYWLMHGLRAATPAGSVWCGAQFDTLRLTFLKVAARISELATRINVSLPTSCPVRHDWRAVAAAVAPQPP